MATPNLSANLPWQGLAAGGQALSGLGGDPTAAKAQLGNLYQQQYGAALDMNRGLFDASQTGYENLRSSVDQQYQDVLGGYQSLYGDVLGRIAGTNSSNIMDINTNAAAQSGAASQQMVSRGLGNSTVQQNMQRAIALDRARAVTDSENRFAQLGANYASQIGGDRLRSQQQGIGLGAQLGQAQLGMLERVNAGYPDAGMYGSLAQMYGSQAEADKNRRAQQDALNAASRGQFSSAGTSSPASPFGSRPLSNAGYSGYSGGMGSGNIGGYGGGFGYVPAYEPAIAYNGGDPNNPMMNRTWQPWNTTRLETDYSGVGDQGQADYPSYAPRQEAVYPEYSDPYQYDYDYNYQPGFTDNSGFDYNNFLDTSSAADLGLSDAEWY